jgi:hypothetical protein
MLDTFGMITSLGIDYSTNSPAVCFLDGSTAKFRCLSSSKKRDVDLLDFQHNDRRWVFEIQAPPKFTCEQHKFHWTAEWMLGVLEHRPDRARIENYAFAGGGRVFQIAEATQTFKSMLWRKFQIDLELIQPTSLKKEATGSGKAKKPEMADAFERISGFRMRDRLWGKRDENSPSSDCVDAFFAAGGASWAR